MQQNDVSIDNKIVLQAELKLNCSPNLFNLEENQSLRDAPPPQKKKKRENVGILKKTGGGVYPNPTSFG